MRLTKPKGYAVPDTPGAQKNRPARGKLGSETRRPAEEPLVACDFTT